MGERLMFNGVVCFGPLDCRKSVQVNVWEEGEPGEEIKNVVDILGGHGEPIVRSTYDGTVSGLVRVVQNLRVCDFIEVVKKGGGK